LLRLLIIRSSTLVAGLREPDRAAVRRLAGEERAIH
jgi:hypothetical protein